MSTPHDNLYTRLKPSKIHKGGIGVFAIRTIPKGHVLFTGTCSYGHVRDETVKKLRGPIRQMYEDFCIFEHGTVTTPGSFEGMGMAWYLNSSKMPNCEYSAVTDILCTTRRITTGEELTIDYNTFSDR
jgi:SET domain-containing protein